MSASPLAITCGDPAGVGPEVISRWLETDGNSTQDVEILGPSDWLKQLPVGASCRPIGDVFYRSTPGAPEEEGARLAWECMKAAAAGCQEGRYRAVVTGPVSKSHLSAVGYPFPGQTEFFADAWGGNPVMAFRGDHLRVVLATWHIPLADVSRSLTSDVLQRAVAAAERLAEVQGLEDPRIAVCGLNPHAGEGGILGPEERDVIDPVLDKLRARVPGLSRALPGDTVFGRALKGDYDVVIAQYHDQGLGPLKTVDFDNAVNVTLGLPFVRTSPDHGTGFDIAGKGIASSTSFARAVEFARKLSTST